MNEWTDLGAEYSERHILSSNQSIKLAIADFIKNY